MFYFLGHSDTIIRVMHFHPWDSKMKVIF